ncbi:ATP-binding cassette domain-containing protein [Mucilaginibacter sp. RS28]|uniref:ATP-binding cassette domain-containing protein n=1 Tax=Mucilaginibacter straminoryzae TaxID=2932774 RepID=A0A9X2BA51_9SPHI|nr:ATP-binding cassette domain-containing protein [Mucilaginibacter straminoryzae]MCJ8210435.1 ATP-binding cassette domain-containing protein [Mucilaginibacter straminoryzae]
MISVQNISKHYGPVKAVDGVSFEVAEGETVALLGTSGCGKTTTLKMINRLIEPTAGELFIDGKNVKDQPAELLRRSIGYVLQNTGLFPHYTIEENIGVVPSLLKWDKQKTRQRTLELLEKLHLPQDVLKQYPSQLSGGQQQRVGLARALVADAPVLLMDEPFGALDNITRTKIQEEFKQLDELKRKTIIMVTHDVQEAFTLADRICLMHKGKIVQIGTPQQLLFHPAIDFVKQFLEGQRLQLELASVKVTDLWDNFSDQPGEDAESETADITIWEAFRLFTNGRTSVTFSRANERKKIDFSALMLAFQQYQEQQTA